MLARRDRAAAIDPREVIMSTRGHLLLSLLAVVGLAVAGRSGADESCHNINAKGVGQDLGGGITHADIQGGGLLQGETDAVLVITGFSGTVASFSGTIVFTV